MTTMEPCLIWSVCLCFWGLQGVDLYPGRLGMPSSEMVPWREPPGGPEPQAIAAFVLCAAGAASGAWGRADGVGGSLGCLLAHSFVRQGRAPGRFSESLWEIMQGGFTHIRILATNRRPK